MYTIILKSRGVHACMHGVGVGMAWAFVRLFGII